MKVNKEQTQFMGKKLLELRKSHDLTQAQLADKIGVSRRYLASWESGEQWITTGYLIKLSEVFGIQTGYFFPMVKGFVMKRDMDLIRLILLKLEGEEDVDLSDYSRDQVNYHSVLLQEAGMVEGAKPIYSMSGPSTGIPVAVHLTKLTWKGHEFLDNVRKDTIWGEIKKKMVEKGISVSIETIMLCATAILKSKF